MGDGSKKNWTIVNDIRDKEFCGPEFLNPKFSVGEKEKKSVFSVMNEILIKGKNEFAKAMESKGQSGKRDKKNTKTCRQSRVRHESDGSTTSNPQFQANTLARSSNDRILPATVLPILSATARLSEPAADIHNTSTPENSKIPACEVDEDWVCEADTCQPWLLTDKDLLALYNNPRRLNFKWTTIPKGRRTLSESTTDVSAEIDRLLDGLDSVESGGELMEKNESPTRILQTAKQTTRQKTEEGKQRGSPDNEAEIDKLLDGEVEWKEFWAPSTSQKKPKDEDLFAKLESPRRSIAMSMGRQRRGEAVKRYLENKSSSLPVNQSNCGSSTSQQKKRPMTSRQKREDEAQRSSSDIEAEVDKLLEGETDWEGSSVVGTPPSNRDLLAMFESPKRSQSIKHTRWQAIDEPPRKKSPDILTEFDELPGCDLNPNDRDLLALFESPIKGLQSTRPTRLQKDEEALKRYENACQSALPGLSSSTLYKSRTPAPRHSQIADSSRRSY